jgi:hypothetical protein
MTFEQAAPRCRWTNRRSRGLIPLIGNFRLIEKVKITERFTRAVDQLGRAEVDVRIGGIYALERLTKDSPGDRAAITKVLTAFVRGRAFWPASPPDGAPVPSDNEWPVEVQALHLRAPDVQAAMVVLGHPQSRPYGPPQSASGRSPQRATERC